MKKTIYSAVFLFISLNVFSQYWQQKVKYTMDIDMNVQTNRFNGKQKLEYWNNSPDTLTRVFYHLYWNAFQPGSMMDTRSRRQGTVVLRTDSRGNDVVDWDSRLKDRISKLNDDEVGYQKILSLKMNGRPQKFNLLETILEVDLDKPILPKSKVVFDMDFETQVPVQIRRSGRNNAEGILYSMSQWYPKMVEYDEDGWHPNPYIAREFYGVWGDFDVTISIDRKYMIAATGVLENANQVGFGYEDKSVKLSVPAGNKISWHFRGNNIHDFVWAADTGYVHLSKKVRNDLTLHVFYKPRHSRSDSVWKNVLWTAEKILPYMEENFGKYPYPQYSFIQGGDGGMEYAMATLLRGANLGTVVHEWMHSWYQFLLATNESLYAWMDEGFTSWASARIMAYYNKTWANKSPFISENEIKENLQRIEENKDKFIHSDSYDSYFNLARSPLEEPMTTHADHFNTNYAYGNASYSKGAVFLEQLGYIAGANVRDKILLEYYRQWRFKHPDVDDFIRVAEKVSNIHLDWYKEYWVNSTKTIDYRIDSLWEEAGKTKIRLRRKGLMPMPVDLQLTFKDGSKELHYVPMYLMFGKKPVEDATISRKDYEAWKWTHETFVVETTRRLADFTLVEIDPSQRMADIERRNNKLELKW